MLPFTLALPKERGDVTCHKVASVPEFGAIQLPLLFGVRED
jgi:hypothetical protein